MDNSARYKWRRGLAKTIKTGHSNTPRFFHFLLSVLENTVLRKYVVNSSGSISQSQKALVKKSGLFSFQVT